MRIWSLHPSYLDTKGLVALWRETLLAKHVLEGKTKGYKNHPQLERFKKSSNPLDSINHYLLEVYKEAVKRNYHFNEKKIGPKFSQQILTVTTGQIEYEMTHLLKKLRVRDQRKYREVKLVSRYKLHPMFKLVRGEIESWEVL
jgi:hypothetical protein